MNTVLVTGGARGIGAAISIAFAKKGYGVAVHYNSSETEAFSLTEILRNNYGVPAMAVQADISSLGQVKNMIEKVLENFNHIDVLINNAGIAQQKLFTEITPKDWSHMINVNLSGAFYCTQAIIPNMIRRKQGSVIFISSIWGQTGGACEVHYSAAKAGLIGLTKALAKEMASSNIRVNCIAPGPINTGMLQPLNDEEMRELIEKIPAGRIGTPEEAADTVVFLSDSRSSFITGQIISVNGGMYI